MSIEARKPPPQIALKIRRVLGGKTGWNGIAVQFAFAAVLGWIAYEIVSNARANLENQHIAAGFGFLANNAGFDVNQTLISYSGSDTFLRVFLVGLLNTLVVSVVGIVFATVIGFIVALCRLSPNWLLARVGEIYVEIIRNLPLLFQILFWYLAVLAALPNPRQSISLLGIAFVSNRGLVIPRPIGESGFEAFLVVLALGIVASVALRIHARRALFQRGQVIRIWPYVLGLLFGLPLVTMLVAGLPFSFELPQLKGFNFAGGSRIIPEFVALTLALSTYTAAFIAEIVRAGILAVPRDQVDAGAALGL
ncbi:MAG: amino acid ABC transporter permease, partial [Bradyrhizobium canariense]